MKKSIIALMLSATLAGPASASEPGLDDAFFLEKDTPIFVSKCHYTYKSISQTNVDERDLNNRFFLLIVDDTGMVLRESDGAFTGLGSFEKFEGRWRIDSTSMTTAEMTGQLGQKLDEVEYTLVHPENFSLKSLSEISKNCGLQVNPWIDFFEGRYDPTSKP